MKIRSILTVLIITVALGTSSLADVATTRVLNVLDKLENYTLSSTGSSSNLTAQDLKEAHREFNSWDVGTKESVVKSHPLIELLNDFLFHPMKRFQFLIGDDERKQRKFIERLEVNYKRFRRSYLGKSIGDICIPAPKTDALVESLFGVNNPKPLTLKLLRDARDESIAYAKIERELVEFDDVYANLDYLQAFRNHFTNSWVLVLCDHIFPYIKKDMKEEQLADIKKLFVDQMRRRNIGVRDGELTELSR